MAAETVLVPVSDSVTIRQTIAYAVSELADGDRSSELHLVVAVPYDAAVPEGEKAVSELEDVLTRATLWATEDVGTAADISVETATIGTEEYLFGPRDYADRFAAYAEANDVDRLILDPEYHPGGTVPLLQPLERELTDVGLATETAPVERAATHGRLVGKATFDRVFALFWISYGFYLILGDPTYWFDLVTGAAVAGIVSLTLAQITFSTPPHRVHSPLRVVRFSLYIPYLIYEIVKANVLISAVILRPSMPIEPRLTRVNARVRSGLPLLALANSITLTPGTLTVRANDQRLLVHTLIPDAREDLFEGRLERAVRFVFYGRRAARIATPRERGDTEIVGGDHR
ncbi:monovalent cation/H+ antiporter subunit E [Halovivax gelatinilyticus]|uniref:monovalent cation/H+ antiporter subunit E n=1 Tax=Halovivax gelatinilyticus TaxID=2961597 RepID=UPI0020CA59D6|nr:monovalent cation/H+ antiporter subunit E [Halovivax gelatinilyticus]